MTPEDFTSCFDRFQRTAFRLETLQRYSVEEDEAHIAAWWAGQVRPDCSVRTSPWAARIATTTIAGKSWCRVRVVELPLSEYVRWEMAAYVIDMVYDEVGRPGKHKQVCDPGLIATYAGTAAAAWDAADALNEFLAAHDLRPTV